MRLVLGLVGAALVAGACSGAHPAPSTTPAPAAPAKILLRFHPPAGARYTVVQTQVINSAPDSGSAQGMPASSMTIRMFSRDSVLAPAADTARLQEVIDSGVADTPGPFGGALAAALAQARGMHGVVAYDDRMTIRSVAFTAQSGESSQMSESMSQGIRSFGIPLPAAPVAPGDTWSTSLRGGLGRAFPGISDSLVLQAALAVDRVDVTAGDTTVTIKVRLTFPDAPFSINTRGMQMTMQMSGAMNGEEVFSLTRGMMSRTELDGTIHMTATSPMLGAMALKVAITQHLTRQVDPAP